MKKILALTLTIVLTLCLALPTFAREPSISENNGTASVTVNGTFNAGSIAAEVISVDVSWGSMSFTYNDTVEGTWNDDTHNYDGAVAANWTCEANANKITVTNHSNTPVEAQLTFAKADNTNIEGNFTETFGTPNDGVMMIDTAVGTLPTAAPTVSAYFNVTAGSITANGVLGTITLKIVNK